MRSIRESRSCRKTIASIEAPACLPRLINGLRRARVVLVASKQTSLPTASAEAARQIGVSEQTYYRWRKQYGGMTTSDAKRLKELEKENARLKKLVADLSLDNAILKDVAEGKF